MLPAVFLLLLLSGPSIAGAHALNRENIKEEMSREVEEEFSGKEAQEELELLKEQYDESHSDNENYIDIPSEFDVNVNNTDLFEGDIRLSLEQWNIALGSDPENPRKRRQGVTESIRMWEPRGNPVIPYEFTPGFPAKYKKVVEEAIAFWQERTCIFFRPSRAGDKGRIRFNHTGKGCSSEIGFHFGSQEISLQAPLCMTVPVVTHELAHAFGTKHVQTRADRDKYVRIDTKNIKKGEEHNFAKVANGFSTYGVPYEFGSKMHYPPDAFAKNSRKPTIYAKAPYQRFQGSMDGPRPTFWDTILINRMYKCKDMCIKQMDCQNGGVTHGGDCTKCFCPRGWSGTNCEKRPDDATIVNLRSSMWHIKVELTGKYTSFEEKLVILQAPAGKRVEAIVARFGPKNYTGCRAVGIEIIPTKDTRSSGYRYCAQPPKNPTKFVSEGDSMLVWLYREVNHDVKTIVSARFI